MAGKYELMMLCVAAASPTGGFKVLDVNWRFAEETAAEDGHVMDRRKLRLMGPMHIAETREKARENVRFGLEKYIEYARTVIPGRYGDFGTRDPVDVMLDSGHIVIGTPDDAVEVLTQLREKQGVFGGFLHQCHDWADWEATKKSYELYIRFVAPKFDGSNDRRDESYQEWRARSAEFSAKSHAAAQATFDKYGKIKDAEGAAEQTGMIGAKS